MKKKKKEKEGRRKRKKRKKEEEERWGYLRRWGCNSLIATRILISSHFLSLLSPPSFSLFLPHFNQEFLSLSLFLSFSSALRFCNQRSETFLWDIVFKKVESETRVKLSLTLWKEERERKLIFESRQWWWWWWWSYSFSSSSEGGKIL